MPSMRPPTTALDSITRTERLANWTRYLREEDLSPRTIRWYVNDVRDFLDWLETEVGDISPTYTDAATYRDILLTKRKSTATVNRKISSIKRYMVWAIGLGLAQDMGRVRSLREVVGPRPALSRLDGIRLIHTLERHASPRDRAMVMLMLGLGLRVSEVSQLLIGEIETGPRHIDVHIRSEHSKGRVSRRVRGLAATSAAVVSRIRELQDAWTEPSVLRKTRRTSRDRVLSRVERLGWERPDTPPDLEAVPLIGIREPAIAEAVKALGRLAQIPNLHPHMLRRTYGQIRRASGAPIEVVSRELGHVSVVTTARYTEPQGEDWDVMSRNFL